MRAYDYLNRLSGWSDCRVSGTLPAAFLNRCASRGVALLSAVPEGEYSYRVRLRTRDMKKAGRCAAEAQCTLEPLASGGAPSLALKLRRRALLALGLLLAFFLLAWSKLYIWEISVTGNETVSAGKILDALRECGVGTGTFWPDMTSDIIRSKLLTKMPELAWATVNIHGSRAEVIVRERVPKPEIYNANTPIDLIAAKSGFVTEVRALNGTALVKAGSAVLAGEPLILSRMDSAFSGERYVHAAGTVTAETYYELSAATPLTAAEKVYTGETKTRLALVIGNSRWNFYGNSSISPAACDKITEESTLSLGGIFSFPVSLVRETERFYTLEEKQRDLNLAARELEAALHERLLSALGEGGGVESEDYSASSSGGLLTVCLRARCSENIAVEKPLAREGR